MTTTTSPPVLLDSELIRARRLELGLSVRRVATHLGAGFSQTVIRNLEAGTNHKELTLGDMGRLADLLALPAHQLLATEASRQPEPAPADDPVTAAESVPDHVAQLGALLFDLQLLTPVEALAAALGLTLEQTERHLEELDQRFRPVGLVLHRLGQQVKVQRMHDAAAPETMRAAWRTAVARRGLDVGQAHLVHQALTGKRTKTLRNDQQVTANQLVNAGILERSASGGVQLSQDVRYSLALDEAATGGDRAGHCARRTPCEGPSSSPTPVKLAS